MWQTVFAAIVLSGAVFTAFAQTGSPQTAFAVTPFPLPLDKSNSYEALTQHQRVEHSERVTTDGWRHEGLGQLIQGPALRLLVPVVTG